MGAAERIRRQDHDVYVPRVEDGALFPGYVFVQVINRWRHIANTKGVLHVIRFGDAPALLHHSIIRDLRNRENADGIIELPSKPKFVKGDKVRIVNGPLDGIVGLYEGMDAQSREHVLLQMLGGERVVSVDSIEAA